MSSRRKVRECALQLMFQWDINRGDPEKLQELYWSSTRRSQDQELQDAANRLFSGALEQLDKIDAAVKKHAENWRLDRMAAVDRNILRLAIYEMTNCIWPEPTPPAVVINEALDIARRYSGEAAVPFINGVLDGIRKSLAEPQPQPARP
jgi:N utilization substance protein B